MNLMEHTRILSSPTSAKCLEEGVNLLLSYPTGSLLAKQ